MDSKTVVRSFFNFFKAASLAGGDSTRPRSIALYNTKWTTVLMYYIIFRHVE